MITGSFVAGLSSEWEPGSIALQWVADLGAMHTFQREELATRVYLVAASGAV